MKALFTPSARRLPGYLLGLVYLALAACGGDGASMTGPTPIPGPQPPTSNVGSGQVSVPAGAVHTVLTSGTTAPANLGATVGRSVVITLQHINTVGACTARCPSIDWSGPQTFANRLTVQTTAGAQTFFLTQDRGLASTPDDPDPT